jgi:hypothetical protein
MEQEESLLSQAFHENRAGNRLTACQRTAMVFFSSPCLACLN